MSWTVRSRVYDYDFTIVIMLLLFFVIYSGFLYIRERIRLKLAVLMYKACTHRLPSNLYSMVTPRSSVKGRSCLRSASDGKHVVPGTRLVFDPWSFTVASPFGIPYPSCIQFPH